MPGSGFRLKAPTYPQHLRRKGEPSGCHSSAPPLLPGLRSVCSHVPGQGVLPVVSDPLAPGPSELTVASPPRHTFQVQERRVPACTSCPFLVLLVLHAGATLPRCHRCLCADGWFLMAHALLAVAQTTGFGGACRRVPRSHLPSQGRGRGSGAPGESYGANVSGWSPLFSAFSHPESTEHSF